RQRLGGHVHHSRSPFSLLRLGRLCPVRPRQRRGVLLAALGPKLAPPEAAGQEEGRKTTGNLTLPASAGKPAKALRRPVWPPRPACWALLVSADGHRCCEDIHEAFLSLACAIICWRRLKAHPTFRTASSFR